MIENRSMQSGAGWIQLLIICVMLAPVDASAESKEEGQAAIVPWSGYWWPHREGAMIGALERYDAATGSHAAQVERATHPPGPSVPSWHGYCHAWAASSVLEPEPRTPLLVANAGGQPIPLAVGVQKAWLAACHSMDVANSYGDRFGDGIGGDDRSDLSPDQVWRLLKLYVKQQGVPLIFDIEAGSEVWNYPVYAYRISWRPIAPGSAEHEALLVMWMADNGVARDHVGLKIRKHDYRFRFEMVNNSVVMGSGKWVGRSVDDHPDFAWYPFVARAENAEVDYAEVQRLLGAGEPDTAPATQPVVDSDTADVPSHNSHANNATTDETSTSGNTPIVLDDGAAPHLVSPPQVTVLSPAELTALVAHRTSDFALDVTVDRFDGGHYDVGETFRVRGASSRNGYLYLLHIGPNGELQLLYPQNNVDHLVTAGAPIEAISGFGSHGFPVANPTGINRVKAVVTSKRLCLTGLQDHPHHPPGQAKVTGRKFRWHPAQHRQIQRVLERYQRDQQIETELGAIRRGDLEGLLGEFAQDEVVFYVRRPND